MVLKKNHKKKQLQQHKIFLCIERMPFCFLIVLSRQIKVSMCAQ